MRSSPPRSTLLLALLVAFLAALLGGCAASAPVLYAKAPLAAPAADKAQRDIELCGRRAQEMVGRHGAAGSKLATASARAGTIGFVGTAAATAASKSSSVWERARGAAAGGALGIATKLLLEWNEGDKVYQEYVERCLEERGHDVLGWR